MFCLCWGTFSTYMEYRYDEIIITSFKHSLPMIAAAEVVWKAGCCSWIKINIKTIIIRYTLLI